MKASDPGSILERREELEAPPDPERYRTLRRLIEGESHRVVVGLGGGSIPGLCGNLALLKILEELGLRPHVEEIWGTSAGSVIGSGWATGNDAMSILELVKSLDKAGVTQQIKRRLVVSMLMTLWPFRRGLPDGLMDGAAFRETIERGLKVKTFEECPTPFRCIACTDDGRAGRKIFRRGPLLPAVFSSMSIPGIMIPLPAEPGQKQENFYDGGLVEKSPLMSPIAAHIQSGEKRKLLLLVTHFDNEASRGAAQGFHNRFLHTLYALEDLAWHYQLGEARERENVDLVLLNPKYKVKGMFDFARCDEFYLLARERFLDLLQNAKIARTFGAF